MPDIQHQLFTNAEFVEARSGETFATSNPATEEKIADVASAGVEDVDAAVRAARAQMEPGSDWQKMKPRDRAKILWRIADMLSAKAAEIGRIETIDNGKPIFESQFVDTPAAAFTGSTEVGKGLMARAAKTLKKVSLELGGKSPNVVFADSDLEAAARGALNAIFYGKGEVCAAGSRLLIEESAHDELMAKVTERANKLVAADHLHPNTRLGALVSRDQMETVLSYIEAGKTDGAKLVAGGERADIGTGKGYFVKPTIFDDVEVEHRIAKEEIFGPVLATIRFKDADRKSTRLNATVYGLAAAVWTRDISKAYRIAKSIQAGTVWINTYNLYDPALPFGGFKESGFGRDQGKDALEKYTQTKSVWVAL